jgi:succinate dehydrogenase/fumarate reductase-like Fe-S protein
MHPDPQNDKNKDKIKIKRTRSSSAKCTSLSSCNQPCVKKTKGSTVVQRSDGKSNKGKDRAERKYELGR